MDIVRSAKLNTVIGKRDGNSLTFLNLGVDVAIGGFKTTVQISFLCKGRGVPPKLIKSPLNLDRNIIKQMLDEAKLLLLPKPAASTNPKTNESSKPVVNTDEDSTKVLSPKKKKSTKTRKSTKAKESSKTVVNTADEDDIMSF